MTGTEGPSWKQEARRKAQGAEFGPKSMCRASGVGRYQYDVSAFDMYVYVHVGYARYVKSRSDCLTADGCLIATQGKACTVRAS